MAGAWVTAWDLSVTSRPAVTVVTSDDGSFSITGLREGREHSIRVRAYGFRDRFMKRASGTRLSLDYLSDDVLDERERAAQYPSSYWVSLIEPPAAERIKEAAAKEHISASGAREGSGFADREEWTTLLMFQCAHCHQIGNAPMRFPRDRVQWERTLGSAPRMRQFADRLGRDLVLDTLTSWSQKIASGALPHAAPERPRGPEARYRVTEFSVGKPFSWHRELAASYIWDPSVGAAPPKGESGKWVYTADVAWGTLVGVNVETGAVKEWQIPTRGNLYWPYGSRALFPLRSAPITLEVDAAGRIVILAHVDDTDPPGTLVRGLGALQLPPLEPPAEYGGNHDIIVFDPRDESWEPISTTCDNHAITLDRQGRYWLTREEDKLCMYDPATKKEHHFPFPEELRAIISGNDVSVDGKVWFFTLRQNRIARFDPETEQFDSWEVPEPGYFPRHVRTDAEGRPWILLSSGHLARFDPKSEKFDFYELPGAAAAAVGKEVPIDIQFTAFVDRAGEAGEKDGIFIGGNFSDSILYFSPTKKTFVRYRMPGPFYTKDLEVFDGAVWAMHAENPSNYGEPDAFAGVPVPKLVRLKVLRDEPNP